jgi:hypothetical protein
MKLILRSICFHPWDNYTHCTIQWKYTDAGHYETFTPEYYLKFTRKLL